MTCAIHLQKSKLTDMGNLNAYSYQTINFVSMNSQRKLTMNDP